MGAVATASRRVALTWWISAGVGTHADWLFSPRARWQCLLRFAEMNLLLSSISVVSNYTICEMGCTDRICTRYKGAFRIEFGFRTSPNDSKILRCNLARTHLVCLAVWTTRARGYLLYDVSPAVNLKACLPPFEADKVCSVSRIV